jgi:hypothetical protein
MPPPGMPPGLIRGSSAPGLIWQMVWSQCAGNGPENDGLLDGMVSGEPVGLSDRDGELTAATGHA